MNTKKPLQSGMKVIPRIKDLESHPGLRIETTIATHDESEIKMCTPIKNLDDLPDIMIDAVNEMVDMLKSTWEPPLKDNSTQLCGTIVIADDNGDLSMDVLDLKTKDYIIREEIAYWYQRYNSSSEFIKLGPLEYVRGRLYGNDECFDALENCYYQYLITVDGLMYKLYYESGTAWDDICYDNLTTVEEVTGLIDMEMVENSPIWKLNDQRDSGQEVYTTKDTTILDLGAMRAQDYKEEVYANTEHNPASDQATEVADAITDLMELLWDIEAGVIDDTDD